jgi:predicted permease
VDVWLPLVFEGPRFLDAAGRGNRQVNFLSVIARLAPGADLDQARGEMDLIARRMAEENPETDKSLGSTVVPLHEQVTGQARPALVLLLGCVGLVLVIASANVANLMLARSLTRTKELAVRAALGAGRGALLRQTLAEGMALAAVGGAAGLLLGQWGLSALMALAPANVPRLGEAAIDARVVGFAVALSIGTGLLIGMLPGITMLRRDLIEALRGAGRNLTTVRSGHRARAVLVAGEVAIGVVLCCAAGLLVRSLVRVLAVDPGFRSENLLTLQISLPEKYSDREKRIVFYRDLLARLEALPGVTAAGGTTRIPLGSTNTSTAVRIEGRAEGDRLPEVEFRRAVGDYFVTMGIPVLRGRDFQPTDTFNTPGVVVINETMAGRLWPGADPIGARVKIGPDPNGPWLTVIGVIGDVRHATLEADPPPELYITYTQGPPMSPFLAVRASGDLGTLTAAVRQTLRDLDRDIATYDIRPMEQVRAASVASRRFLMLLVALFGATALGLAALGVYGLTRLIVAERTQEMGIRLALGARPSQVLALVLRQGMRLAGVGAALGVGGALAMGPAIASQLYGVGSRDLVTLIGAPLVLMAAVLVGSLLPARRATRIDPMRALREE